MILALLATMTIKLQSLMVLCIAQVKNKLVLSCPVGGSGLPDLLSSKTIIVIELHRRHFPLGGHMTTATQETTSNAGILLRCWVMFGLVKYILGIVLVTK
jgi:hypothetical protein